MTIAPLARAPARVAARASRPVSRTDSPARVTTRTRAWEPREDARDVLRLGTSTVMTAMIALSAMTVEPSVANAADTGFCVSKCQKECLRIAPGSDGYCADACGDECNAMAADGEDISENSSTSVFTTKKESTGLESMLVGIVDKSAVFFAPGADLAKDPACED